MTARIVCGFCVDVYSVERPEAASKSASVARGSMALGMSRWLMNSRVVRWAAFAQAASVASRSPRSQMKARLPFASAWICCAPSATASGTDATAGSSR